MFTITPMKWTTTTGLAGRCLALWDAAATASLAAGIPTRAERVLDSGLNSEVQVWRAPEIDNRFRLRLRSPLRLDLKSPSCWISSIW